MRLLHRRARSRPLVLSGIALCAAVAAAGCGGREKPAAMTFAYSNDLWGEIRSCGCAVRDKGGLGRRATFVTAVRDTAGDMLLIDAGDMFGAGINYGIEKADLTLKSMALMGYDGVVIGEDDLGFGLDYIRRRTHETHVPVLVANLYETAGDTLVFPPSRVVTMPSGRRVGIIGVMSPDLNIPAQVKKGSIEIRDPVQSVQPLVDGMRADVDVVVVLAHMPRGEAAVFARNLHGVDVVFLGHEGKRMRNVQRYGDAYVLETGEKGMYMGVSYVRLKPGGGIASLHDAAVVLDKRFEDAEAIAKLFSAYDLDIAAKEKASLPTGVTNVRNLVKDPFQGADACRECHASIYQAWSGTKHAHAWETLTDLSRQYDQDCIPCHTVGFYKNGGFENLVATPSLTGVQCESCHGNAARHVEDPDVKPGEADPRSQCHGCHTAEQSPDFDVRAFWKRIDHGPDGAAAGAAKGR